MELITQPPVQLLYWSDSTTLEQLGSLAGTIARDLYAEAARQQLLVGGPVYWIYHGFDGRPETRFILDIGIPVQGTPDASRFACKWLPPFRSLSTRHAGAWTDLPVTYKKLMDHIDRHRIPINEECRELYWNIDLKQPENNRVEIQMGVE